MPKDFAFSHCLSFKLNTITVLLWYFDRFSSGDQTVLKGEGGGAENGKLVGEESNVSTENQKQVGEQRTLQNVDKKTLYVFREDVYWFNDYTR